MSNADVQVHVAKPTPRVALGVAAAVIVALIVNTAIAFAVRSLDGYSVRTGVTPIEYAPLTVAGVLVGTAGWVAVRRFAARPRAVLRVLVPVVVALSFVPDVILLAVGNRPVNVAGLMVMHLFVALITVTTLVRILPLADKNT
jgi:hypothetical protein